MPRILFVAFLVVVACNGADPAPETAVTTSTSSPPVSTSTTPPPPGPDPASFQETEVGLSADGTHLVDGEGRPLYMFTLDTDRTSSCEGGCAQAWPPLLGDPQAGDGVDPELLGNAERRGGDVQVTYGGHPLYRYREDRAPGDARGHGFNDLWFLVAPDGSPLDR
ncbi:MAG: hypothetical protein ACLFWM_07685 [Actinomycetota bacterium]